MDRWDNWDDPADKPKPTRANIRNIQDYLDDLYQQELPVKLVVSVTPDGLYYRARIVDAENTAEVLLDRRGERYMEVTGLDLAQVLSDLDAMAAPTTEG